jgi:hypothetical protein
MVKQTGFLYELRATDYITGASPILGVDVNSTGDWTNYLPTGEKQYKYATFDTMSCTSFSFLNAIETSVNFLRANNKLSPDQITTLNSLGFYADGKFNCSDRFTAIMSGTMPNGNYFQSVGDSVRRDGLLPEALLQFGGNTQLEYLDKSLITEDIKAKAKKILDIFDIKYEWTSVLDFKTQLKQCPLQGAIPEEASHAVMIPIFDKYFDSYEPYLKPLPVVKYAMKVIVTVKIPIKTWKYFKLTESTGSNGHTVAELNKELVDKLDIVRDICGFPFVINSGYRTVKENSLLKDSVTDSAHTLRLAVDIKCTDSTKRMKIVSSAFLNGFKRMGIAPTYIHLDLDQNKPNSIWLY